MRYSYLLISLLILASCGGKASPEPNTLTVKPKEAVSDSLPDPVTLIDGNHAAWKMVSAKDKKTLEALFGHDNAIALFDVNHYLPDVKTDADLYLCYCILDSVCEKTTEEMIKVSEKKGFDYMVVSKQYKTVSRLLPALQFTCEAECTMPRIMLDYQYFTKLAKTTVGTQDDEYFSVMKDCFGDSNSDNLLGATWFSMTWDYGGNSLLGSGTHYQVLKHCQSAKTGNMFRSYIEKFEEMCFGDALEWHTLYHTGEKAIAELKKIGRLEIGKQHSKELEKRILELEKPAEDLQLDCEHQDCSYG